MSGMDFHARVETEIAGPVKGSDESCAYYPCHFRGQDCTFCYCPLYPCLDKDLGRMVRGRDGRPVWSCADCFWTHRGDVAKEMHAILKREPRASKEEVKRRLEARFSRKARSIMILGATSGAGKSMITMGLCRMLSDMGYRVAPFKSQNMSLNSCVTPGGEEIARAQELQARAARAEPTAAMNPILLKPKGNAVSQVVVEGRPYRDMDVRQYYGEFARQEGLGIIRRNHQLLARTNDFVVIEGAGSPAEINLGEMEIANMPTADIADADCLLVVNIEWGGAFAYIFGTMLLMKEEERRRFKGVIINNMHGGAESLSSGMERVERELSIEVLGVLPHLDLVLPSEDSMFLGGEVPAHGRRRVGVIRLPRISNFTDFDALALEDGIAVQYVEHPEDLEGVSAIILPGTKNTVADMIWMRERGLAERVASLRGKVPILGVCGGYQMLGGRIVDAEGIEGGEDREIEGLGLLDADTVFDSRDKRTVQVEGHLLLGDGGGVRGYEIHMGRTESRERPLFRITSEGG
ncbi:MAG: cobyric acid synthase, partial [Methanomassiliicoccales archaeon]|nr:cobyric acid synthase [Methanomassiliicoccales archaeon]